MTYLRTQARRFETNPWKLTFRLSLPVVAVFAVLLAGVAVWDERNRARQFEVGLEKSARAYYQQVLITRLWNARHGGVYVRVGGDVRPNPYLEDPEREILAADGRVYTKINPAFMTRQLSELARKEGHYRFHITSLRPVNPANAPDPWEEDALRAFEGGASERKGMIEMGGERYFRYMAPLIASRECLACHAKHGYAEDDVRGGLSVTVPTAALLGSNRNARLQNIGAIAIVGLIAIAFIVGTMRALAGKLIEAVLQEVESEKLLTAVQMAGAAAHELRQPLTIIVGVSEMVRDKQADGEPVADEVKVLVEQSFRMDGIIKRMLNITSHKTRAYAEGAEIFDLGSEGSEPDKD